MPPPSILNKNAMNGWMADARFNETVLPNGSLPPCGNPAFGRAFQR